MITVTLPITFSSGVSICAAETTIDSATGLIASARSMVAHLVGGERRRLHGAVQAWSVGQQPIVARRAGSATSNRPSASVCTVRAPSGPTMATRAETTGRPSGSRDTPRTPPRGRQSARHEHEQRRGRRLGATGDDETERGPVARQTGQQGAWGSFRREHAPGSPVRRSRKDGPGPGFLTCGSRRVAPRLPMPGGAQ